jgi:hypothetical protein
VPYTLSGWAGAEANALMARAEFALEFFNGSSQMIGSNVLNLSTNGLFVANGQPFNYKQYTLTTVAPPGSVFVRARVSMIGGTSNPQGGGQAFVVDDFSLIPHFIGKPRITSITVVEPGAAKRITAQGETNRSYTLQVASNLAAPIFWSNLATTNANASGEFEFLDSGAFTQRFYRLLVP